MQRNKAKIQKIIKQKIFIVDTSGWRHLKENKAEYMTIQSRTVGQEQQCKNCSEMKKVMDGQMNGPTDHQTNQHGKM